MESRISLGGFIFVLWVMESGNEFHSVIVLAAKDFWNWVEAQRGILSLSSRSSDRPITQNQIQLDSSTPPHVRSEFYTEKSVDWCVYVPSKVQGEAGGNACTPIVLTCDPASSPPLDSLQCITVLDEMRIPYNAGIFHTWPYKCNISYMTNPVTNQNRFRDYLSLRRFSTITRNVYTM